MSFQVPGKGCYGHIFRFTHYKRDDFTETPRRPEMRAKVEQLASEEEMER